MRQKLFVLCLVTFSLKLTTGNVRRQRYVSRLAAENDPQEREDSPVIVQLNPRFYDQPGVEGNYGAQPGPSDVKDGLYLELSPRQIEAEGVGQESDAAFALRVNPVLPRNFMSVKKYNNSVCEEKKKSWCVEVPPATPKICAPIDTDPPSSTTCGPVKPTNSEKAYAFCNPEKSIASQTPKDLCEECQQESKGTTQYVPCYSKPPPTASEPVIYCNPTTMQCRNESNTYKVGLPTSTAFPPPTPPPCDSGQCKNGKPQSNLISELRNPARYYILVKRSPEGWAARKKRSNGKLRRRFRLVPELYR